MAEVVLDANVIVALLYAADSQHARAVELTDRLEAEGHDVVLVDFLVFEALSVLCRRAAQRKTAPPDLNAALAMMRNWFDNGEVRFLAREQGLSRARAGWSSGRANVLRRFRPQHWHDATARSLPKPGVIGATCG